MIINCTCTHPFQDSLYGEGKRIMNATNKENVYRCTVCGQTKGKSYEAKKEIKKEKGKKK